MELSDEARLAMQIIETTGSNLFLTGKAGTGKTTFLRALKRSTSKRNVVLAPTGIAAINAEGSTIHSFFQLPFAPYIPGTSLQKIANFKFSKQKIKIIRSLDLIVIDEISMVRADVLDLVDCVLRHYRHDSRPFGGVQMLLIGDLGQLAPVAKDEEWGMLSDYYPTPYFFSSHALCQTQYSVVELTHVYRQSDRAFVDLLNKIRDNCADRSVLDALNSRYIPDFHPSEDEGYIRLTTHNAMAQKVNTDELDRLPGKTYSYRAEIEGKFPELSFPTDKVLHLKLGAQVMFVKNDSSPEKRYYNGMIGRVSAISTNGFCVIPKGQVQAIDVTPEEWENNRYELDERTKEITEVREGLFRQYPVKTAWAITIHKSQGLTFSHAIIDASASFAHGQTYVALSRCKSLDGLVLSAPIPAHAIIRDASVDAFNSLATTRKPDTTALELMQRHYFLAQLSDLFGFSDVASAFYSAMRIISEHYGRTFPKLSMEYKARNAFMVKEVVDVATAFKQQYTALIAQHDDYATNALLQERITKGADYFLKKMKEVETLVSSTSLETDNKEIKKRTVECFNTLVDVLRLKHALLAYARQSGFSVATYLRVKAMAAMGETDKARDTKRPAKKTSTKAASLEEMQADVLDIKHKEVYKVLCEWRRQTAEAAGIPAYCIMHTRIAVEISNALPSTIQELTAIKGFGAGKAKKYGEAILRIVRECK